MGCVGLLCLDGYCEIKCMFVCDDARGRGIGRCLLVAIETAGADLPCIRLETGI